jgi:hypothetical protein
MALDNVGDYITSARTLLQDTSPDYRYSDADLVNALNIAITEAARVRPDLYFKLFRSGASLPSYSASNQSVTVAVDRRYKSAYLYYIVGQAQLRDDESTQDARASGLLQKFIAQLTTIAA